MLLRTPTSCVRLEEARGKAKENLEMRINVEDLVPAILENHEKWTVVFLFAAEIVTELRVLKRLMNERP